MSKDSKDQDTENPNSVEIPSNSSNDEHDLYRKRSETINIDLSDGARTRNDTLKVPKEGIKKNIDTGVIARQQEDVNGESLKDKTQQNVEAKQENSVTEVKDQHEKTNEQAINSNKHNQNQDQKNKTQDQDIDEEMLKSAHNFHINILKQMSPKFKQEIEELEKKQETSQDSQQNLKEQYELFQKFYKESHEEIANNDQLKINFQKLEELEKEFYKNIFAEKNKWQNIPWQQNQPIKLSNSNTPEINQNFINCDSKKDPEIYKNGIESYRDIELKANIGQNNSPIHLALVLYDEKGNPPLEKDATYLIVQYGKDGNLKEITYPEPITIAKEGDDKSPLYIERNGKKYTLPINYGTLKELNQSLGRETYVKKQQSQTKATDKMMSSQDKANSMRQSFSMTSSTPVTPQPSQHQKQTTLGK